jgi:hypothetical protein
VAGWKQLRSLIDYTHYSTTSPERRDRLSNATESIELTQQKLACEVDHVGAAQLKQLYSLFVTHKVPAIQWAARSQATITLS